MRELTREECIEVEVERVKLATDKALLCIIEGEEVWIPKSHIHDDSEVWGAGQAGTMIISEWLAEQKGLI